MIEMDVERVAYVGGVLRSQHAAMVAAETDLNAAERQSAEPELLVAVRRPLTEFLDETIRLADLLDATRELMLDADRLHPTDAANRRDDLNQLLASLVAALNDGEGAAGTLAEMLEFGDAELAAAESGAETVFAWMAEQGIEGYSFDDFTDLANDGDVPQPVRDAVTALTDEPVLMSNLVCAGWLTGATDGVSLESIELFVAAQRVARGLGDPRTFDHFDSAMNGEHDDRISWDDVHRVADDETAAPELRHLAELFEANPLVFRMLDNGTAVSGAETFNLLIGLGGDDRISFADVVATAVNTQAFEGRAEAARDFVMGLPSVNDSRDVTGNLLDIRWFSDAGVTSLAATALVATPTLSEQVEVVARLPESRGGIRNLIITEYYRRLGNGIDAMLNPDGSGGAVPLDAVGSSGSNWFMQGAFASANIRPVLVDNNGYGPVTAGWAARQSMADGNQLLFHSLAPAAAAFIETFPPGTELTESTITEFFDEHERSDGSPLFADGDRQLRDSFALLLDAMNDPDPVSRQQTTLMSSFLIGIHEQALVDPYVDRALDQGWDDGFRVLGDIFDPDESIANGQIDPQLGTYHFEADRPLPVRGGHPDHVRGYDLTTALNPTLITVVEVDGVHYGLGGDGSGDVDLEELRGWDDVPEHWEFSSQEIDPALWHEHHGDAPAGPGDDPKLETVPGSTTGIPLPGRDDLPGVAVDDWKNYDDRMWAIINSFQQTHTLPALVTTLPGHGFDEADLGFLPEP